MIEIVKHNTLVLGIILRTSFKKDGIEFFTPNDFSQQLAYMSRPAGYIIQPHVHNPVCREVHYTKEVLMIKTGIVRVDFYSDDKTYLESRILCAGDVVLLAFGGHGFYIQEAAEIIEIKQGPYTGDQDKTRFTHVDSAKIKLIGPIL